MKARGVFILFSLTIVEIAEISSIKEEMCSEKISKPSAAGPERERGIEMHPSSPVGFSSQIITCSGKMLE